MKALLTVASALLLAASATAHAATATPVEAVQTCLTDNTNGKDRKLLARWIFLSMAAHPTLKSLSAASAQEREDTSREFAALVMRLMTVDCKVQMQAVMADTGNDPTAGLKVAFTQLGQVAMQELMGDKDVDAATSQFAKFIDEDVLRAALDSKPAK